MDKHKIEDEALLKIRMERQANLAEIEKRQMERERRLKEFIMDNMCTVKNIDRVIQKLEVSWYRDRDNGNNQDNGIESFEKFLFSRYDKGYPQKVMRESVYNIPEHKRNEYSTFTLPRRCDIIMNIRCYPKTCTVTLKQNNFEIIDTDSICRFLCPLYDFQIEVIDCEVIKFDECYIANNFIRNEISKLKSNYSVMYGNGIYRDGRCYFIRDGTADIKPNII
jgi:hypothetical protein